jgi:hypothetical protein
MALKSICRPLTTGLVLLVFMILAAVPAARGEAFMPYGDPERLVFDPAYHNQAVIKAKEGSYFLLSPYRGSASGEYFIKVLKLDKGGKLGWKKMIPVSGSEVLGPVYPASDGGLLVGLQGDSSASAQKARLVKLDNKGAVAWEVQFPGQGLHAVNECNDKGYILAGYEKQAAGKVIKLLKIDRDGRSDSKDAHGFVKSYSEAPGQAANYAAQLLDEDGYNDGYIVAGYTERGSVRQAYLLRLDAYGGRKWSKEYKGAGYAELTFALPTRDKRDEINGFLGVGYDKYPGKNSRVYLLHTDSYGNKAIWEDRETADSGLAEMSFGAEGQDLFGIAAYEVPDEFKKERKLNGEKVEGDAGIMLWGLSRGADGEPGLRLVRLNEYGQVKKDLDVLIKGEALLPGRSGQDKDYVELLHGVTLKEAGELQQIEYATLKLYLKGKLDNDKTAPPRDETNFEAMIWAIDNILLDADSIIDIEELLAETRFPPLDAAVFTVDKGAIRWPDTSTYLGDLRYGKADGSGFLVFPDGVRYKGEWRNNMFWGQGELHFPSGERYVGSFEEHMMQGEGVYTWPGGEQYRGEFFHGKRSGQGSFTWPGGVSYKGQFVKDKPEGRGCITWPNGESYRGDMKNGNATGWGTYIFPSGEYYEGQFQNLVFSGKGRYYWNDGGIYAGEFKNDRLNGEGVYAWPNGVQQRGYWKDNRYMGTNPEAIKK